jgi:thiamine-phosphate pyrophosphorylase
VSRTIQICYITDRRQLGSEALPSRIEQAIRAGVDLVQIREKDLPIRELLNLADAALSAARHGGEWAARIVINDRLDVALAAGAHGLHLGTQSLPPQVVREMVPRDFLVGVSCHSLPEAHAAEEAGADYLVLGPIFETPSKLAYGAPLGLAMLREVTAQVHVPVLALGGITLERVRACLEHGAAGIAAIRLFQDCESLEDLVRALRSFMEA